jgi:hypothetical protein
MGPVVGIIIYRILKATRIAGGTNASTKSSLNLVTRVVIESGMVYTLTSIVALGLNVARTVVVYILADSVSPPFLTGHMGTRIEGPDSTSKSYPSAST